MSSRDLIDLTSQEEAKRNQEQTLKLVEQTARNFLEIGRLLNECYEKHYWAVLGYKNFREYIRFLNLPVGDTYSWVTRLINVYKMSLHGSAPPREELAKIGPGKLSLLLPAARRGELTVALWEKAKALSYTDLRYEIGQMVRSGDYTRQKVPVDAIHSDMQRKIEEIGKILGKYVKREYRTKAYRYDVVWKDAGWRQRVSHVFEIQVGGDVDNALSKLREAYDGGCRSLFMVISTEEDRNRAEQLLSAAGMSEIASVTLLIGPDEIDDIHRSMERNPETFRKFLGKS